jgi:hypothetical protein
MLTRSGVRPNQISVASAVFGAGAGVVLAVSENSRFWFLVAAACIQARLLCNLFDGMVAVEGGFRTKSGEIFNELPDRFADAAFGHSGPDAPRRGEGLLVVGLGAALAGRPCVPRTAHRTPQSDGGK